MKTRLTPKRATLALAILCGLNLSGCATYEQAKQANSAAEQGVAAGQHAIASAQSAPVVQVVNRPYLVGEAVAVTRDPAALQMRVQIATAQPITLAQAAMTITQQTGVPIQVSGAILGRQAKSGSSAPQSSTLPGLPGQPPIALGAALPGVSSDAGKVTLNYSGTLKGLLDTLSAQTHTYWKYEKGTVRFFLTETRVFTINALPGQTNMSSTISNSGSGGSVQASGGTTGPSQTGQSGQSAGLTVNLDPYKSIEDAVKTILKQSGADEASLASVSVDPTSGQIVVTATPPELDAVAQYVQAINAQMSKNVLISVNVYSVSLSDSTSFGVSLNAALSGLLGSSAAGSLQLGGQLAGAAANNLAAGIVSGPLSLNALASALNQVGHTSLVTSGQVIALNGQPSPLQVSTSNGYLAATTTTSTANVGSSTSLTPGSVISGFSGTFLPLVRGNNILLEYALSLSQNQGFLTASSGGSTIQVPNTTLQTTSNRVSLKSGDTVVLAGFEQNSASLTSNTGASALERDGSKQRTALVIVMHVVNLGQ